MVSVEPDEISDSCFSNHGFDASMIGTESFLRAATLASGGWPRTLASMGVRARRYVGPPSPRSEILCCEQA